MPKLLVALALAAPAAGYIQPAAPGARATVKVQETKADLEVLAKQLNPAVGFWDPLGCLNFDFWQLGNEGTIGYLRHAEIKHGRVAMAGFLGYLAQSTDFVSGPHNNLPFRGYEPGLTPPEQWDAIPLKGKLQIFIFIGMLESYGEILPVHYTKGGLPGYYPPIKSARPEIAFNLYDPFNWFDEEKDKVRGRQVEINNGRLAMLGLFSILSESKVPGSVPALSGLIPEYSGNYMVPFEGDFSLFFVSPEKVNSATLCNATKEDMADLAEANPDFLGRSLGLWDPLGCLNLDFWKQGNEATIGYLRHAEIKHGRVAMAGFLGYLAQSTDFVSGPHNTLPFRGYEAGLTPPEQWDAIPLYGKLQILVFVGMLESYGEGAGNPDGYVHYTKGGLPGYFPAIAGRAGFGQVTLNLYDPLGWFNEDKDKVRGRQVEINNGRLAMLGIFSLLSEAKVPGAVPPLAGLIPAYSGNCMVPFEGDFSISSIFFVNPESASTQSARPLTPCDASKQEMAALAEAK